MPLLESNDGAGASADRCEPESRDGNVSEGLLQAPNQHTENPEPPPRLIRSRRKRYLELNPAYYASASGELELSDPLSYDRLVRKHQSAAEREDEGKRKGWAKTLETSLLRGEAKLEAIRPGGSDQSSNGPADRCPPTDWRIDEAQALGSEVEEDTVGSKTQALAEWRGLITERFVLGKDDDFAYATVDANEDLDGDDGLTGGWVERKKEADWFEDEEAERHEEDGMRLDGQTGVQDF